MTSLPKCKLVEVRLPVEQSVESRRERNRSVTAIQLRSTCGGLVARWQRAVPFAQLVDDPSANPERVLTDEDQANVRQRLFDLVERLVG